MDIRCAYCNSLLAKDFQGNYVEIKCRKCKATNVCDGNVTLLTNTHKSDYSDWNRATHERQ